MPFQIIRNDITKVRADVIVNTANPRPVIGSGTDRAIYRAAGEADLLAARRAIGDIPPGEAKATPAFALAARHIIHTPGPMWVDGTHQEREILRACYANALSLAAQLKAESIAFPLIATGVYGFPKDEALAIAMAEIGRFLLTHDMTVILVVFDRTAFALSEQLVGQIDAYIDEHSVGLARQAEYGGEDNRSRRREELRHHRRFPRSASSPAAGAGPVLDSAPAPMEASFAVEGKSLDEVLSGAGETFQQRLFQLIDQSGMDDVEVYKKANIDRKLFSRIRCKADYKPKKKTAVAFAIALELDLPATLDLLSRAELAFSPSSRFDLIVSYFITNKIYDVYQINTALFQYGQPILGE